MTDELLIKFLLKEASEEESITVQQWLAASTTNEAHFAQFKKIWDTSEKLASKSNVDEERAWEKFKSKTVVHSDKAILKPIRQSFNWLKIAAVLFLVAGAWITYNVFRPSAYTDLVAENNVTIERLPDGSEVTLNRHAQISFASNFKNNRSVRLTKGDVFFNVAHDKTRPFIIDIDKVSVMVVGTSFNIKHLKDLTEVIVETGIVKVSVGRDEIELRKGEKVLIKDAMLKLVKEQNKDQLYSWYRSKLFIANNTPLWKLVESLNEAYDSQIVINDPSVKKLTLTTTLRLDSGLDANLDYISETFPGLKITRNGEKILLSNTK